LTNAEKIDALRAVYGGTGVLRRLSEQWGSSQPVPVTGVCGFTVTSRTVTLGRDPAPLAASPPGDPSVRDKIWLEDATAAMGFPTGSLAERFEAIRRGLFLLTFMGLGTSDAFPLFVTKYPCYHAAHAPESAAVVMSWPDIAPMYPENLDGVVAHEIGHVFGAPDEYKACTPIDPQGFFGEPNGNCAIGGAAPPATCLMHHNTHDFCTHTPRHWGWEDANGDGSADLLSPATVSLPDRATTPGRQFIVNGRNVWDARAVFFGSEPTTKPPLISNPDSIAVEVPAAADGIVNVSLLTRAGASVSSFDETWVLVAPDRPPSPGPNIPMVFGVLPTTAAPGTTVAIFGQHFGIPTSITFGGVPADLSGEPDFPDLNREKIEVPAPAGPTGPVEVVVTTSQGSSLPFPPFTRFTYA
jgi:hypothetical protein